jgi:hypothetical protein
VRGSLTWLFNHIQWLYPEACFHRIAALRTGRRGSTSQCFPGQIYGGQASGREGGWEWFSFFRISGYELIVLNTPGVRSALMWFKLSSL